MLLPNKHLKCDYSIIGCGATFLAEMKKTSWLPKLFVTWCDSRNDTVSSLSLWRFVQTLDFLFIIGAIHLMDGFLFRSVTMTSDEEKRMLENLDIIYREAGILLPDIVLRRFHDVKQFHDMIVENRHIFLEEGDEL